MKNCKLLCIVPLDYRAGISLIHRPMIPPQQRTRGWCWSHCIIMALINSTDRISSHLALSWRLQKKKKKKKEKFKLHGERRRLVRDGPASSSTWITPSPGWWGQIKDCYFHAKQWYPSRHVERFLAIAVRKMRSFPKPCDGLMVYWDPWIPDITKNNWFGSESW